MDRAVKTRADFPTIVTPREVPVGGVYIAMFFLERARTIAVGRLGRFCFERGFYFYVGSAQRNLSGRLARHARRRKPLRWHIDYLAQHAVMLGSWTADADKRGECRLAGALGEQYPIAAPRFGASDCRCASHLFFRAADG